MILPHVGSVESYLRTVCRIDSARLPRGIRRPVLEGGTEAGRIGAWEASDEMMD
jgi:hypothetical protein